MNSALRDLLAGAAWIVAGWGAILDLAAWLARRATWGLRLGIVGLLGLTLLWGWLGWRGIAQGQALVVSLAELVVTVPADRSVGIDRAALGRSAPDGPDAEAVVFVLQNQGPEGVTLRDAARRGGLLLDDGTGRIALDRWKISHGAEAGMPNGETIRFSVPAEGGLSIRIAKDRETPRLYRVGTGGDLVRSIGGSEQPLPPCTPESGLAGWLGWIGRGTTSLLGGIFLPVHALFFADAGDPRPIASFGGSKDCNEHGRIHLALTDLPWRSLRLVRRGEAYFLAPDLGGSRISGFVRLTEPDGTTGGFADLSRPLSGMKEIVVGRTRYGLAVTSGPDGSARITFTPRAGRLLVPAVTEGRAFAAPACEAVCPRWSAPYRVLEDLAENGFAGRIGGGETALRWLVGSIPLALLLFAFGRPARPHVGAVPVPRIAALVLVPISTGLALVDPALLGIDPVAVLAMNWLLAGFAITFLCPAGVSMGLFWLSIALMAVLGMLTLSGLAADGDSDLRAVHLIKHKLLFLDLLPPFATALALASPRAMRPWLAGLVSGRDLVSRLLRYGPMAALLVVLLVWTLFGSETGIAGFQPVEAGKFATALLCAGLVAALDRNARHQSAARALAGQAGAFGLILLFLTVLLGAPVWQSDFSPALIIVLLAATIGGSYLLLLTVTWLGGVVLRFRERRRAPLAFMPVPWLPNTERRIAAVLVAGLLIVPALFWFGAGPAGRAGFLLAVGLDSWPAETGRQLAALEKNFGTGLRIPTERVIAWIDLDFDRYRREGAAARAAYRDLEYQVIRSRAVIAGGDCDLAEPLRSAAAEVPLAPIVGAGWTHWRQGNPDPCARRRPTGETADRGPRNVLFEGAPSEIPVVQFDFAASYLIGRFGLGAAMLFYAGQALCVLVALFGIARLAFAGEGDRTDRTIRWFLAVLVAGSTGLFVLHWTISWSNVLGLLPVMGQPMTWLSAATSHHLFMAFPATLAILLGLRHGEADTRRVAFRVPPEGARRILAR